MTVLTVNGVRRSYAKSAVAFAILVPLGVLCATASARWLPGVPGVVLAMLAVVGALSSATLAIASLVVLARHTRLLRCDTDLFLLLNGSKSPAAILRTAGRAPASRARRWLARRWLGHEFAVGDVVEVRSWAEIRATLDEYDCLEGLPFMPEMRAMCGQRARVFRSMHRLFDYRKTRKMRRMPGAVLLVGGVCDGTAHGACDAACHAIWKSAWLRRVEDAPHASSDAARVVRGDSTRDAASSAATVAIDPTGAPRFVCQLTQLHAASQPVVPWSIAEFLRPLVAGNVTAAAFVVAWLTHLFNAFQQLRGGVGFPMLPAASTRAAAPEDTRVQPGDAVVVRPPEEIRATLDDRCMHRGLWFEPDMIKHCGQSRRVQAEVRRIIDVASGAMLTMKTPAYMLEDVHFSGERQLFNAQYEPLYWRGAWLQRTGG